MMTTFKSAITAVKRSANPAMLVVDGRVACPNSQGDADVDWCYTCPALKQTYVDASGARWVRCRPVPHRW